jgi:DNA-binding winged helix-turn-helix (wHTH) protein/tetratricopeptide (TPR) repeat protein
MSESEQLVFQFGPFQLDVSRRLLRRDGQPVTIAPKTLDTLVILVRNHGQLLEKEELIRLIWPKSVVEESNLAIQISQLRKLLSQPLGLDPIVTVPKRGYRFVAPTTRLDSSMQAPAAIAAQTHDSPRVARSGRWMTLAGILLLIALLLSALYWNYWPGRHKAPAASAAPMANPAARTAALSEKDTLLLADIQNETDDPVFDSTLRQALSIQLEQSPVLSLLSDQQIYQSLSLMKQPRTARLTPEVGWELCQRVSAAAVIYSSIAHLANQYIFGLRAIDCRTGVSLANIQLTVEGKDHVLQAVNQAATDLRQRLGESLAQLQQYNTPIEQATTASLPALEAYSIGWLMNYRQGDAAGAIAFFKRAIQLDTDFAMAYAALGQAYSNQYEPALAAENLRRAYALRERVSEREKFYIESRYERVVSGDLEKARQINLQWSQTYPRDAVPHASLSLIDRVLGQYERALEESKEAVRLAPASAQGYANLAFCYVLLNRVDDAKAVATDALSRNLDSPLLRLNLHFQAFLRHDAAAAEELERWSAGQAGIEGRFLQDKAFQLAYRGQITQAQAFSERAIAATLHSGDRETAADYVTSWAVFQASIGDAAQAARSAIAGVHQAADDRETRYKAALAYALIGDTAHAMPLVTALSREFGDDTAVQSLFVPTVRAAMALSAGDAQEAIRLLEATRPYELSKTTVLYPLYIRGIALLQLHQADQAVAEFKKVLAWPGVVLDDPVGALSRLQLARAYVQLGSSEQARAAYSDFLSLWRDADSSVPVLMAAKSEYAKLP